MVIAPDSFKESMSAKQAGLAIEQGFKNIFGDALKTEVIPMADGGEGTTEALIEALDATIHSIKVHDPLFREVTASYARSRDNHVAIIEMAAASGLDLIRTDERNPLITTTFGVGELIKDALNHNVTKIILGIGGSATNDGGSGMLTALGVKFLNSDNEEIELGGGALAHLTHIDASKLDYRLNDVTFEVACDVTNPLLGSNGATYIYGPQKGATEKMIPKLDSALSVKDIPGAGAAGGLGAGILTFFNASLSNGIDIVLKETQFLQSIKDADLVITGEGKIDVQTIYGKTPIGVAKAAKQFDLPVIGICGSLGKNYQAVYQHGIDTVFSIIETPSELPYLLENGERFLTQTAENIARLIKLND